MFTPGIEALSRLGCQASGVEFLNTISDANNLPRFTHKELLVTGPSLWQQKSQPKCGLGLEALLHRRLTWLPLPLSQHGQCQLRLT
jgi:hypothetical protein